MDIFLVRSFPTLYESHWPTALAHWKSYDFHGIFDGALPALGNTRIRPPATELVCTLSILSATLDYFINMNPVQVRMEYVFSKIYDGCRIGGYR